MLLRRVCLASAAVTALLVAHFASAVEPRRIAIEISGEARFDVIYHRAGSNAAGAAFGGLIGAGIQSGIESDQDAAKRDALWPHVATAAWKDIFVKTMTETLAAKGLEPVWIEAGTRAQPESADLYLALFPETFGFRIVDSTTSAVSAYVEFEAIYANQPISSGKKSLRESFYLTDNTSTSYEDLLADTASIPARIESVLGRAARRLTNKVIYNAK